MEELDYQQQRQQQPQIQQLTYINFINAIKGPATKKKYSYLRGEYLKYLQFNANNNNNTNLDTLLSRNVRTIENEIIKHIIDLKENKKLSYVSLNQIRDLMN